MSDPLIADIVIGDMHIGHKTGIIYPYGLEDYKPSKGQNWLYKEVWLGKFLPEVKAILKKNKVKYVHGLLGGDMGDMDTKERSNKFWTKDINLIRDNAIELLDPFMSLCDDVHVLRGTTSHTGRGGQVDEAIARDFDNVARADENNYASYIWDYELPDGTLVNAQHYGKNRSKWGDENLINALRDEIILEKAKHRLRIPKIAYRFHFHWCGMTNVRNRPIVVQVPSWQLPEEHPAHIDAVGRVPIVGGVVSLYKGGDVLEVIPLIYEWETPIWKPKS